MCWSTRYKHLSVLLTAMKVCLMAVVVLNQCAGCVWAASCPLGEDEVMVVESSQVANRVLWDLTQRARSLYFPFTLN